MDKVRENRARRAAKRQGLTLVKSPARDERDKEYGRYAMIEEGFRLTIEEVEAMLNPKETA